MVFIKRKIEIRTRPCNRDLVLEILNIYGSNYPQVRYFKTDIAGKEIEKCYISATISSDALDDLIENLNKTSIHATIIF